MEQQHSGGTTQGSGDERAGADGLFERLRQSLEGDRAHLDAQVTNLESDETSVADGEGFADSGQVAAEQDEARSLAAELREQLDDVDQALARLDAGTYGTCEACGSDIGDERLEAMPATRWCREHAG